MWLIDSDIEATWQAEAGFNYDAVSHRDQFDDGRQGWVSHQVTETRVRWEPRIGRLRRRYDNVIAPALEEHSALQRQLGGYQLEAAQAYQPQAVQDAFLRLPNRSPADAWPEAVPNFQTAATEECRQACQGDYFREFRWSPDFVDQNWTQLLLPVYTTYYLDDDLTPQPVLIHGQSGQLNGRRQASMQRARRATFITAGVAVGIFVVSLILALVSFTFPPALCHRRCRLDPGYHRWLAGSDTDGYGLAIQPQELKYSRIVIDNKKQ